MNAAFAACLASVRTSMQMARVSPDRADLVTPGSGVVALLVMPVQSRIHRWHRHCELEAALDHNPVGQYNSHSLRRALELKASRNRLRLSCAIVFGSIVVISAYEAPASRASSRRRYIGHLPGCGRMLPGRLLNKYLRDSSGRPDQWSS